MKRIISYYLQQWKADPQRKPLILRGARQVGKTHSVRALGKTFDHFVEVNFEKQNEIKSLFEGDLDPEKIIRDLSLLTQKKIIPQKTLLFLDEIQEMPRAITALRYFYEKLPSLHVIAAGSLVDFAIDHVGVPVGRVSFLYLHPMSFFEYLIALGENTLAEEILTHEIEETLSDPVHQKLLRLLGEYLAIGGMPEVVKNWVEKKNMETCVDIQRLLVEAYRQDFQKYSKNYQLKYVNLIFNNLPRLVGKNIKYTHFSTEYRKRELEPCLELLIKANIAHKITNTSGNSMPLGALSNPEKFKLIFLDIALAQAMLGLDVKEWFLNPESVLVNQGSMVESYVGQELLAYNGSTYSPELYYWQKESRGSHAEVDYLISKDNRIIPIEVKSGEGRSLKSLRLFLELYPGSPFGMRFSVHNYSQTERVFSYPLYAVVGALAVDKKALSSLL